MVQGPKVQRSEVWFKYERGRARQGDIEMRERVTRFGSIIFIFLFL